MVKVTRRGVIGEQRVHQEARLDGNQNQPQVIEDLSEAEETQPNLVPNLVPYGRSDDEESFATAHEEDRENETVGIDKETVGVEGIGDLEQPEPEKAKLDEGDEIEELGTKKDEGDAEEVIEIETVTKDPQDDQQSSDDEIDLTNISVQEQIARVSRKQKRSKSLRNPAFKKRQRVGDSSSKTKSHIRSKLFVSQDAKVRFKSFFSRNLIEERSVDLGKKDVWGYLSLIRNSGLDTTVSGLPSYVKEIVCEFYANLPQKESSDKSSGVKVLVRGHLYDFSPEAINNAFLLALLTRSEIKADAEADRVSLEKVAEVLSGEDKTSWDDLILKDLPAHHGAMLIIAAYNWIPSTNKNHILEKRARLVYKIIQGIRFDFGKLVFEQVMELSVLQKKDSRWLMFPRAIFELLYHQHELETKDKEVFIVPVEYKKDARTGDAYTQKMKKKFQTQTETNPSPQQFREDASEPAPQCETEPPRYGVIQLGSIRVPLVGQDDPEASYVALVDTSQALQRLSEVVQRLVNNHLLSNMI